MRKKITQYIKDLVQSIRVYYTKHDYDLENPTIKVIQVYGIPYGYTIFSCKNCDRTLGLDREFMDELPYTMSHGCTKIKTPKQEE